MEDTKTAFMLIFVLIVFFLSLTLPLMLAGIYFAILFVNFVIMKNNSLKSLFYISIMFFVLWVLLVGLPLYFMIFFYNQSQSPPELYEELEKYEYWQLCNDFSDCRYINCINPATQPGPVGFHCGDYVAEKDYMNCEKIEINDSVVCDCITNPDLNNAVRIGYCKKKIS